MEQCVHETMYMENVQVNIENLCPKQTQEIKENAEK